MGSKHVNGKVFDYPLSFVLTFANQHQISEEELLIKLLRQRRQSVRHSLATIQLVMLRRHKERVQVFLIKQPANESDHVEGNYIALLDLGSMKLTLRCLVGIYPASDNPDSETHIYLVEDPEETPVGEWHDVEVLPTTLLGTQRHILEDAVHMFQTV